MKVKSWRGKIYFLLNFPTCAHWWVFRSSTRRNLCIFFVIPFYMSNFDHFLLPSISLFILSLSSCFHVVVSDLEIKWWITLVVVFPGIGFVFSGFKDIFFPLSLSLSSFHTKSTRSSWGEKVVFKSGSERYIIKSSAWKEGYWTVFQEEETLFFSSSLSRSLSSSSFFLVSHFRSS